MNNSMSKFEKMRAEIEQDSEKTANALIFEAQESARESVAAKTASLKENFEKEVGRITSKCREEENRRVSEVRSAENKRVLSYRAELTKKFFERIEDDVKEAVASDKYEDYLKRCAEKADSVFPLNEKVTAFCRKQDVPAAEKLMKSCGAAVKATDEIRVGGLLFRREGSNAYLDLTLDTALEQERENFASQQEMQI